jgi:hypothetical protein
MMANGGDGDGDGVVGKRAGFSVRETDDEGAE